MAGTHVAGTRVAGRTHGEVVDAMGGPSDPCAPAAEPLPVPVPVSVLIPLPAPSRRLPPLTGVLP